MFGRYSWGWDSSIGIISVDELNAYRYNQTKHALQVVHRKDYFINSVLTQYVNQ